MVSFWLLVLFGFIFVGVVLMVFVLSLSLSLFGLLWFLRLAALRGLGFFWCF